jgi:hypothetical protein
VVVTVERRPRCGKSLGIVASKLSDRCFRLFGLAFSEQSDDLGRMWWSVHR